MANPYRPPSVDTAPKGQSIVPVAYLVLNGALVLVFAVIPFAISKIYSRSVYASYPSDSQLTEINGTEGEFDVFGMASMFVFFVACNLMMYIARRQKPVLDKSDG